MNNENKDVQVVVRWDLKTEFILGANCPWQSSCFSHKNSCRLFWVWMVNELCIFDVCGLEAWLGVMLSGRVMRGAAVLQPGSWPLFSLPAGGLATSASCIRLLNNSRVDGKEVQRGPVCRHFLGDFSLDCDACHFVIKILSVLCCIKHLCVLFHGLLCSVRSRVR